MASICKIMTLAVRGLSSGGGSLSVLASGTLGVGVRVLASGMSGGGLSVMASGTSGRRCESGHLPGSHIERPTLNNYRYQYEAIDTYS